MRFELCIVIEDIHEVANYEESNCW